MRPGLSQAIVVLLSLAGLGGIAAVLIADAEPTTYHLLYTALSLLTFALPAAAGLSIVGRIPLALVGWLTAAVAVVGFGITMGSTWTPVDVEDPNEGLAKASTSLFVWSLALGVVCLVLGRVRLGDDRFRTGLVVLALTTTLVTAWLLTIGIVAGIEGLAFYRITAVVGVLAIWSLALLPVVRPVREPA
jgi:hypothetical protein